MRLHVVYLRGQKLRPLQRLLDYPLLCGCARHRQPGAGPILVDSGTLYNPPDAIAIRLRFTQPLEHYDTAAFAPDIPVRGSIEGLALTIRR